MGRRRCAHPVPDHATRYAKSTGLWAIYWRDRNFKSHEDKRKRPTKNVKALLNYSDSGRDPIFWETVR